MWKPNKNKIVDSWVFAVYAIQTMDFLFTPLWLRSTENALMYFVGKNHF